jgi:hypothetical protein
MTLSVVFVILLFSIVQSVVGVGILLFGTPTLLLMGYGYHETLYLILPSSILISFLQTVNSYKALKHTMHLYIYTLPMVVLGLVIITFTNNDIDISIIVGSMLIMISLIRSVPFFKKKLKMFLVKNKVLYYIFTGLIHGISNMGGGMLVVLMSSLHEKRSVILVNIAYVYLLFGIVQMITLYFLSKELMNMDAILLSSASLAVYVLSVKFITKKINDLRFDLLITLLIIFYGILSFLKIG